MDSLAKLVTFFYDVQYSPGRYCTGRSRHTNKTCFGTLYRCDRCGFLVCAKCGLMYC